VVELARQHDADSIVIEDKASGTQLIQELKQGAVLYGIKPYEPPPGSDKILRLHTQTALFESGSVLLPVSAPWLDEYLRELTSFPGSKYDDQVDSTTQALDYLKKNGSLEVWQKL
jgi:predicted phage terminase large subunit-like protein